VVPPLAHLNGAREQMTSPLVAVVGCGNPNRSDDGAGVRVVHHLKSRGLEATFRHVRVLDAGTDGMAVLFAARGCTSLIVVDACRSGAEAGAVFEVPGHDLAQEHAPTYSLHDFRWDHALAAGRKIYGAAFPTDVTVFLIEASSLALGLELSTAVEAATAKVAARICDLVRERAGALPPS
jgi:hydrogenase maturation protease